MTHFPPKPGVVFEKSLWEVSLWSPQIPEHMLGDGRFSLFQKRIVSTEFKTSRPVFTKSETFDSPSPKRGNDYNAQIYPTQHLILPFPLLNKGTAAERNRRTL